MMKRIPMFLHEKKGLMFGLLFYFVSRIPFLAIFSPALLIYAFYKYGRSTLIKAMLVLMTLIFVSDILFLSRVPASQNTSNIDSNILVDSIHEESESSASNPTHMSNEFGILLRNLVLEINNSKINFLFTSLWLLLSLCGLYILLVHSEWSWNKRFCFSILLSSSGAYLFSIYIFSIESVKQFFFSMNLNSNNFDSAVSVILPVFIPLEISAILILNFFIAIMYLTKSSQITFSQYCEYLYAKLFNENSKINQNNSIIGKFNAKLLLSIIITLLSLAVIFYSNSMLAKSIAGFILLVYVSILLHVVILGVIRLFYILRSKLHIDAGWYFITIFIIMLLPAINIMILLLCLQQGVISKYVVTNKGELK